MRHRINPANRPRARHQTRRALRGIPGPAAWMSGAALSLLLASLTASGADLDATKLPPPATVKVDFDRDIKPIFEKTCFRCHGPEKPKSRFRLDNREAALKGGDDNPDDVVPGNSSKSRLIFNVARLVKDMEMPPPGKGEPLTPAQVGLLRAWIDQGAAWGTTNRFPQSAFSLSPTLRWIGVDGNRARFRELTGAKEGWGGGVDHFSLEQQNAPDEKFSAEGHLRVPDSDLALKFDWTKTDAGFVRGGFERWQKYYDDTGGFAPRLPIQSFRLDRDLRLDLGRVWLDLGLTLPNRPQVVLGYEYRFRLGDKSTLQWGPVGTNAPFSPDTKNVLPASKHVNEGTHVVKLDLNYETRGWQLADSARAEFYKLSTRRENVTADSFGPVPDTVVTVVERERHVQGANTFMARKQFADWLSVSTGYLYSRLDGNAAVRQNTLDSSGDYAFGYQWSADHITLQRESQVVSVGSLAGPWAGLTLSGGIQGEWTRQESFGLERLLLGVPASPLLSSNTNALGRLDSASARENFALRFTRIPFTVVFAEARLQQESLARFDQGYEDSFPFRRDTDADLESEEYRVGFNTSPWPRLSWGADFKSHLKHTDYLLGTNSFNESGHLYPGFLLWRDTTDDQFEARLVYRAASWLTTAFNYRWENADFNGAIGPVAGLTEGGPIEAASQQARVYSVNAVLVPFRRLYLSSTLSCTDSRIAAARNGNSALVPWNGNVYSVLSSATYALNPATDLRLTYAWSRSDYGQPNQETGLPAGINFERHNVQAGVTHRLKSKVVVHLAYGFDRYREPTSGGAADFLAHAVFASVAIPWQ